jgi:hypothetical protein
VNFTPIAILGLVCGECLIGGDAVDGTARPTYKEGIFCGVCHTNSSDSRAMRDSSGREIAPFDLWRSSVMANSARDPYWRAVVSVEVAATPDKQAEIEATCCRCHAPMATPIPASPKGQVLHFLSQQNERTYLGLDGVSCTVCHQISPELLGSEASFTGNFELSATPVAIGPHADPLPLPMRQHAGYEPAEGQHILRSALCATCHTLITETLDPDGTETGHRLFEQAAYLEWRNSVFNNESNDPAPEAKSCQDCHLPSSDVDRNPIRTRIARGPGGGDFPGIQPREPYGRHTFLGGNTLLVQLLRDHPNELAVFASEAALEATIRATRHQLQNDTAALEISQVRVLDGVLRISVRVANRTGHKLPTGFPSRRAWIQLEVLDENKATLFASGRFNAAGEIITADGVVLDSEYADGPVQPHHQRIARAKDVQIYESVMSDKHDNATFTLLRGARYFKDNRLLPTGWRAEHPDAAATVPVGVDGDADFRDGQDLVVYEVPIESARRVEIRAALLYQSIGVRHVNEVFSFDTPEVTTFKSMYLAADRRPETLARQSKMVDIDEP